MSHQYPLDLKKTLVEQGLQSKQLFALIHPHHLAAYAEWHNQLTKLPPYSRVISIEKKYDYMRYLWSSESHNGSLYQLPAWAKRGKESMKHYVSSLAQLDAEESKKLKAKYKEEGEMTISYQFPGEDEKHQINVKGDATGFTVLWAIYGELEMMADITNFEDIPVGCNEPNFKHPLDPHGFLREQLVPKPDDQLIVYPLIKPEDVAHWRELVTPWIDLGYYEEAVMNSYDVYNGKQVPDLIYRCSLIQCFRQISTILVLRRPRYKIPADHI